MKKIIAGLVIITLISSGSAFAISKNEPLKNMSKGLDNVVYGIVEVPDNVDQGNAKGTRAFEDCTDKTKDDVGRGVARVVGGVWQLATFWYPKDAK